MFEDEEINDEEVINENEEEEDNGSVISRVEVLESNITEIKSSIEELKTMFAEFILGNNNSPTKILETKDSSPLSVSSNNHNNSKTPINVNNQRKKTKKSTSSLNNNVTNKRRTSITKRNMIDVQDNNSTIDQLVTKQVKIDPFTRKINSFISIHYILDTLEEASRYEEVNKYPCFLGMNIDRNLCDSIPALLLNTSCNGIIDGKKVTGNIICRSSLSTIYTILQYIFEPIDKDDFLSKFQKGIENKVVDFTKNSLITASNYITKLYPQVMGYLKQVQQLLDFLITDGIDYSILPPLDKPAVAKIQGNPDNLLYLIFKNVPDNLFFNIYHNNLGNKRYHKVVDGITIVNPDEYKEFFKDFSVPFTKYLQICNDMKSFLRMFTGPGHEAKKKNVLKLGIHNYSNNKLTSIFDGYDDAYYDEAYDDEKVQMISYVIDELQGKYNDDDSRDSVDYLHSILSNVNHSTINKVDLSKIPCFNVVRGKQCVKHQKGICPFGGHKNDLKELILAKQKEEFNLYKQLLNPTPIIAQRPTTREAMNNSYNTQDHNNKYNKFNNLLVDSNSDNNAEYYNSNAKKEVEFFLGSLNFNYDAVKMDLLKRIIVKCFTHIDSERFEFDLLIDTGNFSYPVFYKSALKKLIDMKLSIPFKASKFSHGLPDGTGFFTDSSITLSSSFTHQGVLYKGDLTYQVYDDLDKPVKTPFQAIVGLNSFLFANNDLRKFASNILKDLADYIDSNSERLLFIEYIDVDTGLLQYIANASSINTMMGMYLPSTNVSNDNADSNNDPNSYRLVYEADDSLSESLNVVVEDESMVDGSSKTSMF